MTTLPCPPQERLAAFVQGRLDLTHHDSVEEHLDDCPSCLAAVETLDDADSSFDRWRAAADTDIDDRELRPLIAAARVRQPTGVLGDYDLQALLGTGGMGQVWKAEHRLMKRAVAVKVLSPDLFHSDSARARFRREAELAGRVKSPHVVAALDAGHADRRDFLVMEFIEGRTLADIVKQEGPLSVAEALDVVRQAALGLRHAHDAGIVHRDVKPSNLIRDATGVVKVLDLGLARACLAQGDANGDLTTSRTIMGTAAYMAPEQALDTRKADARADVYGLGCTLFFLLTGRQPFAGNTTMEVIVAHRERPLPRLSRCPPAVESLVRRMTAKRPEDRPADMAAVIAELDRALVQPARRTLARLVVALLPIAAALLMWMFWPPTDPEPTPVVQGTPPTKPVATAEKPAGPEMVRIEPGEFTMGSPDSDKDADAAEKPAHLVKITRPFLLGKFEVTQAEFADLMESNPSGFRPDGINKQKLSQLDTRRLPVESVSWLDAVQFCNALSTRHKLKPYYAVEGQTVKILGGTGYRLPSEAEWEYACRAGTTTRWSFGDGKLDDHAWHAGNSGGTPHHVGEKKANPWGLHDMHGNVPEWVWDRFDPEYFRKSVVNDPLGSGGGTVRVFRGGSWNDRESQTRSAGRSGLGMAYSVTVGAGFRVARDVEP